MHPLTTRTEQGRAFIEDWMTGKLRDSIGRDDCSMAPVGPLRDPLSDGCNWYEATCRGINAEEADVAQPIVNEARRLFNIG